MNKQCTKCGESKPASDFYPKTRKCKECTKAAVRANYRTNREYYVAYDRKRTQRPSRKVQAMEWQSARRSRSPEKYIARTAVANAVRGGRLTPQPCRVCGSINVQAHHEDYAKPLDVDWLCYRHHREHHGQTVTPSADAKAKHFTADAEAWRKDHADPSYPHSHAGETK